MKVGNSVARGIRRRKVWLTLGVAAVTGVGVLTSVAYADSEPARAPLTLEDLEPAAREDALTMARQEGWSRQEAVRRIGWQDQFSVVAQKLETKYPESFAGAEVTGKGRGAKIVFADAVPAEARKLTASLPVKVRLVGNKGFSQADLEQALSQGMAAGTAQGAGNAVGSYDYETGEVSVAVEPRGRDVSAAARSALRDKLRPVQAKNKNITVKLTVSDTPLGAATEAYMRGGGRLRTTRGYAHCTAAFTVRNKYGTRGISTAHHCAVGKKYLRYQNHGTSRYTTIRRKGSRAGWYGDISWYSRGSYRPIARYYYKYGSTRKVTGSRIRYKNQVVCGFGLKTGRKCTYVYKRGVRYTAYVGGRYYTYRRLTATRYHVTDNGDSGGPWYYGLRAVGVHSGGPYVDGRRRSVYSEIRHLRNGLGLRLVRTS